MVDLEFTLFPGKSVLIPPISIVLILLLAKVMAYMRSRGLQSG